MTLDFFDSAEVSFVRLCVRIYGRWGNAVLRVKLNSLNEAMRQRFSRIQVVNLCFFRPHIVASALRPVTSRG